MSYVFGPVPSRRLGFSLGIDLVPKKVCSLDCIYCQVGPTTKKTITRKEYIPLNPVVEELKKWAYEGGEADVVTMSGNGEPTLNSKIGELLIQIKDITDLPTVVITNGTLLYRAEVRKDLLNADIVLPSLDAVTPNVFRAINRPHRSLDINKIIEGLIKFRDQFRGKYFLEILFCKGINDTERELEALYHAIEKIDPDEIHLNTVVRPPQNKRALPLTMEELERIAKRFGKKTKIIAHFDKEHLSTALQDFEKRVLDYLDRRPATPEDLCLVFGVTNDKLMNFMDKLKDEGKVVERVYDKKLYFQIRE